MRTLTIAVPDALDAVAREHGKSPEDLAQQVLTAWLAERLEDEEDERAIREFEVQEARGEARLVPWEEVDAELAALPD